MKILWLATSSMQLEPVVASMTYAIPKILFTSVSSMNLEPVVESCKKTGTELGNAFHLYRFDEGKEAQHHYDGEVDHNILRKVRELNPDIVIYSGPAEGKCLPKLDTFLEINRKARTMALVCDGACPNWHPLLEQYKLYNSFDLVVNIDGNPNWPKREKDMTFLGPIDPTYYQKTLQKNFKLLFAGGAGSPLRQKELKELVDRANIFIPARDENWGTYQIYADYMLQAKCVVNFPETGSNKSHHVKYRVIESGLAGCCLFERKNPITPLYFEPGVDYVEYETMDDLIAKIDSISDEEIERYGKSLKAKVESKHTAVNMWANVFEKLR